MKRPLTISIVIPVYNEEGYLEACLEAIAKQTVPALEVIVVDNNSTDSSVAIAKRYPFVKLIKEPHQGVLFARNRGFEQARGKIIGRIDADTILPANWVETCLAIFTDQAIDAVTGPVFFYDMPFSPHNYVLDHGFKSVIAWFADRSSFLFGTNMALRQSAWQAVKSELCERRDIFEDLDLAIHLHQRGHNVAYKKQLKAGMSSRRYDDRLADFYHYLGQYGRTYRVHHVVHSGAFIARFGYLLGYIVLYPFRRSYDMQAKRYSFKRLFGPRNPARKNPMY